MTRDARRHRSPNAGWPEAAMAGALGVRLSGPRIYHGSVADEPWLNEGARDPLAADIGRGLTHLSPRDAAARRRPCDPGLRVKEQGMREHGGNLDLAQQRFGGRAEDWIDLSTGINRVPYPVGEVSARAWSALPSRSEIEALHQAARHAYRTSAPIVAIGGRASRHSIAAATCGTRPRAHPRADLQRIRRGSVGRGLGRRGGQRARLRWRARTSPSSSIRTIPMAGRLCPERIAGAAAACRPPRRSTRALLMPFRELSLASEAEQPGTADPALVRKVLWSCRPAAWVCDRQLGRHRQARGGDVRPVAGVGRGDRDRLPRLAR